MVLFGEGDNVALHSVNAGDEVIIVSVGRDNDLFDFFGERSDGGLNSRETREHRICRRFNRNHKRRGGISGMSEAKAKLSVLHARCGVGCLVVGMIGRGGRITGFRRWGGAFAGKYLVVTGEKVDDLGRC